MNPIVLIQGSLRKESKTALMVEEARQRLEEKGAKAKVIDLRDLKMDWCDGRELTEYSKDLQEAYKTINQASRLIFGMPVYCYSVSGPLKNFIDITAEAMVGKTAGILCNAGGEKSYLASVDLIKILAYESRVNTVAPTVYSWYKDFDGDQLVNDKVKDRLEIMIDALLQNIY